MTMPTRDELIKSLNRQLIEMEIIAEAMNNGRISPKFLKKENSFLDLLGLYRYKLTSSEVTSYINQYNSIYAEVEL